MKYKVRVWCPDCCGEDFQGCFDGSSSYIDEDVTGKILLFDSEEAAKEAGYEFTNYTIWKFEVEAAVKP